MSADGHSRRGFVRAAATALATGLAGCLGSLPGTESPLERQLETVREATTTYHDPRRALEDGFQVFGPHVPGLGWHLPHPARGQEAAKEGFDIERPNLLTYGEGDDGWFGNEHWSEFRPPDPDVSSGDRIGLDWGALEGKAGERTERVVDVAVTHPDLTTLHGWDHMDNPDGVFNPVNPEIGGGDHGH